MASLVSSSSSSFLGLSCSTEQLFSAHHLSKRFSWAGGSAWSSEVSKVQCRLPITKESASDNRISLSKEPHKYFDQVFITVRSGDGGHGAVLTMPKQRDADSMRRRSREKGKMRSSYKRDFDGSLILPVGGSGGDVILYADEEKDTLLEFHKQKRYNAKRGGNVNTMGFLDSQLRDGLAALTLRVSVPVGTVVKNKRGKLLADLARPGDEVLVARGGQGGISLLETTQNRKKAMTLTTNIMRDESDKVLTIGQPGEEVALELILRVVADVGLVGLPNAGKSTLLAAITCAKPDIADYPFTTLMPNLGRLDGDPLLGAAEFTSEATLADLPGLIQGAHLGRGLGRNFLRHLRRTKLLVHVVDAAAEDPLNDYRTVREELRMYNPNYIERPYIVVLNKIDLPQAQDKLPLLTEEILKIGNKKISYDEPELISDNEPSSTQELDCQYRATGAGISSEEIKDKGLKNYSTPMAVVGVSVLRGIRVEEMLKEIRTALRKCRDVDGNLAELI